MLTASYPRYAGDATAPFIESMVNHVAGLGHDVHLVVPEHREWRWPRDVSKIDSAMKFRREE